MNSDLHHRGTQICRRLSAAVAEIAPDGIGRWVPAWDIVAPADAEFMIALADWEADPTDDAKLRVKATYTAVLDAWRRAAVEYGGYRQGAGR